MRNKAIVRYIINGITGIISMTAVLFLSAGRIDWWQAWAYVGVLTGWIIVMDIIIIRFNPGLVAERLGARKGSKSWDMVILTVMNLLSLSRNIIAGYDHRFTWTGEFALSAEIIALVCCVLGYGLFCRAAAFNSFFSQIVRIQTERGHTVATHGPYRFVRHPAYLGGILFEAGAPILLSSWWALIPSVLNICLLILRTALEDRILKSELPGYEEYASRVRYRLIPRIW